MYRSKEYWNSRLEPNKTNKTHEIEDYLLPDILKDSNKILDFGCGIGRTFKYYKNKSLTGVDFSSIYEERAKNEAKKNSIEYVHLVHDIYEADLPFLDKEFELGVMIKVLLHAKPTELVRILTEMKRVCDRVFFLSYKGSDEVLAEHCFNHNYEEEISKLGYKIKYKEIIKNQIAIIYE
jgi:SAM-dependent methyltransferase